MSPQRTRNPRPDAMVKSLLHLMSFSPRVGHLSTPIIFSPEDAAPAPRVGMAEGQEEGTNGGGKMWESAIPRCDVILGSALIYSPHHACVANVLLKAFSEGGCGAAYIVQLSTRC